MTQLMVPLWPAGVPVTVPLPFPAPVTVRAKATVSVALPHTVVTTVEQAVTVT
jgi:hypothetical protein